MFENVRCPVYSFEYPVAVKGGAERTRRLEDQPTTRPTGLPTRFFLGAGRGGLQSLCSISRDLQLQVPFWMLAAAPEAFLTRWQRDGPDIVSSASISHRLILPSRALRQISSISTLRWRMLSGCRTRMHPLVVLRPNSFSILSLIPSPPCTKFSA